MGPDISWNICTIWLITFTRNAFDAPEINADLFVYICDVTFEIRTRAERHVIRTRGNSRLNPGAWTKAKPSSSRWSHRKTYQPAVARIYHSCVELAIFIGKDSVPLKFSLNTPHDQLRCRHGKQMTVWRSSISHAQSPAKTGTRICVTSGGGDRDTCHKDNVVTW